MPVLPGMEDDVDSREVGGGGKGDPKGKGKGGKGKGKETNPANTPKYPSMGVTSCKQLTPAQLKWARKQTPVDPVTGKTCCWGASAHSGCPFSAKDCRFSHQPIRPEGQHWTLEAALNLRGGNKARKAIPVNKIDAVNAALAKQAKAAAEKARLEGGSREVGKDAATETPGDVCTDANGEAVGAVAPKAGPKAK